MRRFIATPNTNSSSERGADFVTRSVSEGGRKLSRNAHPPSLTLRVTRSAPCSHVFSLATNRRFVVSILCLLALTAAAFAQRTPFMQRGNQPQNVNRGGLPVWENNERFKADLFTFVRVKYSSQGGGGNWAVDYPDSDLNFSYRLHELTALEVDPYGKIIELFDEALFDYPFIYLIEPGQMLLEEAEVTALRRYLLNGGFLMVDDFWGEQEWANFYREIKRVFPDREPVELPLEHEIFHIVYDLKMKPQVPGIGWVYHGRTDDGRPDAAEPHYRGIFDDKGRMMAIVCQQYRPGRRLGTRGGKSRIFQGVFREVVVSAGDQYCDICDDALGAECRMLKTKASTSHG